MKYEFCTDGLTGIFNNYYNTGKMEMLV